MSLLSFLLGSIDPNSDLFFVIKGGEHELIVRLVTSIDRADKVCKDVKNTYHVLEKVKLPLQNTWIS